MSGRHLPGLDGLRAVAVLGVMAYHLGFGWASGGYLGVDLFFVLSGFLITSLLLEEWCSSARIRLAAFWGRRARRLLPALFLVLVAVAVYAVVNGRFSSPTSGGAAIDLSGLRGDALATLFYVANWHSIFSHQSYFTQFSTPSPLQHTWSLAIEEQFYLVWPLVIVALVRLRPRNWRRVGLGLCVVGALASAVAMAVLYHPGADPSRIYYGTDTRAFDLLAGAALAFGAAARPQPGPLARARLHIAAPVAVVVLGVFWASAGTAGGLPTSTMFRGGFLGAAVLAAIVIADVRQLDQGPLAKVLSIRPLGWIGTISYGLYLWHWPIFVYLNTARTGLSGIALTLARVGLTFALASTSFYLVERPVRRHRFSGLGVAVLIPGAVILTALSVVVGTTASVAAPLRTWTGGGLDPGSGPTVAGAGGFGNEVPITLPPSLVVDKAHPLRVLTFGDSVMGGAQFGIEAALKSTGEVTVIPAAIPGWGLTVPGSRASLGAFVKKTHPQLAIGTWSWDNAAAKADPTGYAKTLDAAIRQLLSPTDGVLGVILLQMPVFGLPRSYSQNWQLSAAGLATWNEVIQRTPMSFPGKVMYLPVASSLEINGHFTSWLPPTSGSSAPLIKWVRVRTSDGVHLCPPGITRYAAPILEDLSELFHLELLKPSWWNGYGINERSLVHSTSSFGLTCPTDHPAT